jgi:hypothetical protein
MATGERTGRDIADLMGLWSVAAQAYLDGDLRPSRTTPPTSPSPRRTAVTPVRASTGRTRP